MVPNLLCFSIIFYFVSLAPPISVVEDRYVMQRHRIYMTSFVTSKVQTTVASFFRTRLKKERTVEKNDIVIIFDSDIGPLPGFTQIQYQCKSSSTWVNYGGW